MLLGYVGGAACMMVENDKNIKKLGKILPLAQLGPVALVTFDTSYNTLYQNYISIFDRMNIISKKY